MRRHLAFIALAECIPHGKAAGRNKRHAVGGALINCCDPEPDRGGVIVEPVRAGIPDHLPAGAGHDIRAVSRAAEIGRGQVIGNAVVGRNLHRHAQGRGRAGNIVGYVHQRGPGALGSRHAGNDRRRPDRQNHHGCRHKAKRNIPTTNTIFHNIHPLL